MRNRVMKLVFPSLAALLLAACSGTPTPESGYIVEGEASHLTHNRPLTVKSQIASNSPQTATLTDNVSEQVSIEAQPPQGEISQEIVASPEPQVTFEPPSDSSDSAAVTEMAPIIEETLQIASAPEVGYRAPEFEMLGTDGNPLRLCDFDRPILLNFWNTGCKPCRDEMRYLQKVYDEGRDEGLLVLAVNIGQSPTSIESFMEANDLHLPVLFDTNAFIARQYQIQYLPTSFFIDTDCTSQEKVIGSFPNKAAIEKKLASIMPE